MNQQNTAEGPITLSPEEWDKARRRCYRPKKTPIYSRSPLRLIIGYELD